MADAGAPVERGGSTRSCRCRSIGDGAVPVGTTRLRCSVEPIAKALGVPARLRGLRRVRNTPSQVDLPHAERQRNVAGAFAPGASQGVGRVLLVDDVRTTGATLRAASDALRQGGASEVHTLVLAARVLGEAHVKLGRCGASSSAARAWWRARSRKRHRFRIPLDYLRVGVEPGVEADAVIEDLREHGFEIGRRIDERRLRGL